eukprot:4338-Heterococcus_DN1.PRE.4
MEACEQLLVLQWYSIYMALMYSTLRCACSACFSSNALSTDSYAATCSAYYNLTVHLQCLTVRLLFGGTVGAPVTGGAVIGAAVTGAAVVGAAVVGCAVVGCAVVGVSVCLSDGAGVGSSVMLIVGSSVATASSRSSRSSSITSSSRTQYFTKVLTAVGDSDSTTIGGSSGPSTIGSATVTGAFEGRSVVTSPVALIVDITVDTTVCELVPTAVGVTVAAGATRGSTGRGGRLCDIAQQTILSSSSFKVHTHAATLLVRTDRLKWRPCSRPVRVGVNDSDAVAHHTRPLTCVIGIQVSATYSVAGFVSTSITVMHDACSQQYMLWIIAWHTISVPLTHYKLARAASATACRIADKQRYAACR